jgi:predicted nucleotidyltransferase component of viral defense system
VAEPKQPLRGRLSDEAQRLQAPLDLVERDYALGHVLAAIYERDALATALIFKGGTALKKAYFGDYRFSVDLDFTAIGGPRGDQLEGEIAALAQDVERSLGEHGPFTVVASRRPEQRGHPTGQEAFRLAVRFPWHPSPLCSIKIEVTTDEPLLLPASERPLVHGYEEDLAATLRCYVLEEIVAEKLRTMLQAEKRLEEGRWLRNCARDYYDLWRLCADPAVSVDFAEVASILPAKLAVRGVEADSVDDFFPARVVEGAERQWGSSLAALVRPLPPFTVALGELRAALVARAGPKMGL